MKSQIHKSLALVAMLISLVFVVTNVTAKKPGKPPPTDDPLFTANSELIQYIEPNPADNDWQIVFRHTVMDLTQFTCSYDGGESITHEPDRGIMVLKPKSRKVPAVARLEYWFQSDLESGDTVTYLFFMEGVFDDPDNWPPSDTNPETTLTFNYWEVAAENKWAQRQDCAGGSADYPDPDGSWTISVSRN